MSHTIQHALSLTGRLMLALLFIPAGISKMTDFAGTVGYIASAGLPMPQLGAVLAIIVEVGAGLMIALGWKTRWAALALALFTLAASVFFHDYWAKPADQAGMQQLMFYKNLAVAGGLLLLGAFGPGWLSLDDRARRQE